MKQIIRYKDGQCLSYMDIGDRDGFPILIQHGMIASITETDLFQVLLHSGARLVSVARPGYGESSPYLMKDIGEWADLVSTLSDELSLTEFDVLGMSSGAPYAYALGHKFPDKARNIFIFSGIPALYDGEVQSHWPYPITKEANLDEMQALAHELFFSNLSAEDLEREDIKDSMANDCFGIAQDLCLRGRDWGFCLEEVRQPVSMSHSLADDSVPFITALITSQRLPNCTLERRENGVHFSKAELDDFLCTTVVKNL